MPVRACEYWYACSVRGCRGRTGSSSPSSNEHARRDRPVLVARERGDAQHLDRGRDQVRARVRGVAVRRRVEKRADVAIFDRAAKQVAALEHLLRIEDRAVARRQHRADRPRQPHLVRREGTLRRDVQHVARSEPADRQDATDRWSARSPGGRRTTATGSARSRTSRGRRTAAAPPAAGCRTARWRQKPAGATWVFHHNSRHGAAHAPRLLRGSLDDPRRVRGLRRRLSQLVVHVRARSPRPPAPSQRGSAPTASGKGQTVAIWGENRAEWIVALWGCLLEGVVLVPIDYRASADFLLRVADDRRRAGGARRRRRGRRPDRSRAAASGRCRTCGRQRSERYRRRRGTDPGERRVADITADTRPKSSSRRARRPSRRGSSSPIATSSRTSSRSSARWRSTRDTRARSCPIRFLNLLPLSHMFGQAMATFVPPMLPGVVVFTRSYAPEDIVRQIRERRISVLVCVPKMLEVLREHVLRRRARSGRCRRPRCTG